MASAVLVNGGRHSALLLVDVLLELDAGSELGNAAGSDLEDASGLRIAAVAGLALRNREGSEANQGDAIAFLERDGYGVNEGIDGGGSAGLANAGRGRDFINEISLVHDGSSAGGNLWREYLAAKSGACQEKPEYVS